MALVTESSYVICYKCGKRFGKKAGNFPAVHSQLTKGMGYLPICKMCTEDLYAEFLKQFNNEEKAMHSFCRKLDLYWSKEVYQYVAQRSATRSLVTQYITRLNTYNYTGKSYDDTIAEAGETGVSTILTDHLPEPPKIESVVVAPKDDTPITDDIIDFWGTGYTPSMYRELERRLSYWRTKFPENFEFDIGTEVIIKQICFLELDINRDRAEGKPVDKNVNTLNTLLGSANLKPAQKKGDENLEKELESTPMGVWLWRYENQRPLPEVSEDLKDVNGIKKYIFTWMGHLCKMLNIKNGYTRLYEEEIERLRVERPEYSEEDDESLLYDIFNEEGDNS